MTETVIQAVDTPAPDANVPQETEVEAAPSPAVESPPKGVGKRIDELTRLRRDAERDRDYWREFALRNSQQPQPAKTEAVPSAPLKTIADFGFDEAKHLEYLQETIRTSLSAEARAAAKAELTAERERQDSDRRKATHKSRESEFARTVEDYSETWDALTHYRIPDDAAEAIMRIAEESDDGPALLYHLGKNQELTEKIAQLPPLVAARELGKIEARLAYEREKAKEKPKVSQAPPPPPKVEAVDPKVEKDPSEMTDLEYAKWRRKQIAARNGR